MAIVPQLKSDALSLQRQFLVQLTKSFRQLPLQHMLTVAVFEFLTTHFLKRPSTMVSTITAVLLTMHSFFLARFTVLFIGRLLRRLLFLLFVFALCAGRLRYWSL